MSQETNNNTAKAAAIDLTPLTPEEIVEQIRILRLRIPQYVHLPIPDANAIRRAAHVSIPFRDAAINTMGAAPDIGQAVGYSSADLRREADESVRMSAVEDELRATLNGVTASNLVRKHRIGLAALQAYSITRQLVRKKENAHLLPFFKEMTKLNKFGRRRPTPPEQTPQPANPADPQVKPPATSQPAKP